MNIYLVRHGNALSNEVDPQRPLSEKGKTQVKIISDFMKKSGITVATIMHSGKKRAEETAEQIASRIGFSYPVQKKEGLSPNDPVDEIVSELKNTSLNIMIVGHLPFMSYLASQLLAGEGLLPFVDFEEASVLCLNKRGTSDKFTLEWSVNPQILQ